MNDERYKALMANVGMPNSRSLLQALRQVANEVWQESNTELRASNAALTLALAEIRGREEKTREAWGRIVTSMEHVNLTLPPRPICASHALLDATIGFNHWDAVLEMNGAWDGMTAALAAATPPQQES